MILAASWVAEWLFSENFLDYLDDAFDSSCSDLVLTKTPSAPIQQFWLVDFHLLGS